MDTDGPMKSQQVQARTLAALQRIETQNTITLQKLRTLRELVNQIQGSIRGNERKVGMVNQPFANALWSIDHEQPSAEQGD